MIGRALAALVPALAFGVPALVAQIAGGGCTPVGRGTDVRILTVGSSTVSYYSSPHMRCDGGVELWADSAISRPAQATHHFIGNVLLREGTAELRSHELRYFPRFARMEARGSVFLTDSTQGFTISNGLLNYLLATPTRLQAQLRVRTAPDGVRPTARVEVGRPPLEEGIDGAGPDAQEAGNSLVARAPTDSLADDSGAAEETVPPDSQVTTAAAEEPAGEQVDTAGYAEAEPVWYDVEADEIFVLGNTLLRATGDAVAVRDSLTARADTLLYTQSGAFELVGASRVESTGYRVSGRNVALGTSAAGSDRLTANGDAHLDGGGITVTAPRLVIDLVHGDVERLSATNTPDQMAADLPGPEAPGGAAPDAGGAVDLPARPFAASGNFEVTADSIDARSPGRILERISAFGQAHLVARGRDSLDTEGLPPFASNDWIEGDSVIVSFLPPSASAGSLAESPGEGDEARVDRVTAWGNAKSMYRIDPLEPDSIETLVQDPQPASDAAIGEDHAAVHDHEPPAGRTPGIHYVVAAQITIVMADGEVETLLTRGDARGFHLEPSLGADSIVVDTAATGGVTDTTQAAAVVTDTTRAAAVATDTTEAADGGTDIPHAARGGTDTSQATGTGTDTTEAADGGTDTTQAAAQKSRDSDRPGGPPPDAPDNHTKSAELPMRERHG